MVDLCRELLQATRNAHTPALVAEVTLDLTQDGGRGKRGELESALGIKAVDCLEQAQIANLHQVVERLTAVLKFVGKKPYQVHMGHDELLTCVRITGLFVATKQLAGFLLVPSGLAAPGTFGHIRYPP